MKTSETSAQVKKILMKCLAEGGAILKKGAGTSFRIHMKGPVNPVTDVDLAIEKKLMSLIRGNFPEHRILSEESPPMKGSSGYRWIVDPLDGTINFAHNLPLSSVSIGVEKDGVMILGGVYNPMLNELFFAEKGNGAFLNGKRIRVSPEKKLIKSLLVTGFPYDRQDKAEFYLAFVRSMMEKCTGLRRLGSAAMDLAYVACGRFEAFWEFNLQPWDVAAGILLVEEAGGKVTNYSHQPVLVDRPIQLLASNGGVHEEILDIFKKTFNRIDIPIYKS